MRLANLVRLVRLLLALISHRRLLSMLRRMLLRMLRPRWRIMMCGMQLR